MTLKINPIVATLLMAGILILLFVLIRGCKQSKIQGAAVVKADSLNKVLRNTIATDKANYDSSQKQFHDTLEFERGQYDLVKNRLLSAEINMQATIQVNRALIESHKLAQYVDTSAATVPGGFITECEGCFTNLEKTTNEVERYKKDINDLEASHERQDQIYQKRFKELDAEKLGFYNKINTLAKEQQKAIDKLKPRGRLYLSWGVLWSPFPVAGGAGLLYQNKYNLMWGAKCYYGRDGYTIETSINFPLSLRFK